MTKNRGKLNSGRDLLTAYHAGVEVTCRLFDATHVNHILHGFHSTATCGMVGASAAVARLRQSDLMQSRHTLGIAASQSGGFQQNFGTSTKPYQAGRSAECAIVADDFARRGFTASTIILEGRRGFFMAQGGGHEEARIRGKLGNPWSFAERGVWLKPFPTGSLSHPGMSKMLELVRAHDIRPDQVGRVRLRTSENIFQSLMHHRPETELEAKFSLEFCLAALLVDRACGLAQFTDEYVNSPEIQKAIAKVEYTGFSESEARNNEYSIVTTFVEIDLKDGRSVGGRVDHGKGNVADPMSEADVAEKFRECADHAGLPPDKAERAISLALELERLPNLGELADSLTMAH